MEWRHIKIVILRISTTRICYRGAPQRCILLHAHQTSKSHVKRPSNWMFCSSLSRGLQILMPIIWSETPSMLPPMPLPLYDLPYLHGAAINILFVDATICFCWFYFYRFISLCVHFTSFDTQLGKQLSLSVHRYRCMHLMHLHYNGRAHTMCRIYKNKEFSIWTLEKRRSENGWLSRPPSFILQLKNVLDPVYTVCTICKHYIRYDVVVTKQHTRLRIYLFYILHVHV